MLQALTLSVEAATLAAKRHLPKAHSRFEAWRAALPKTLIIPVRLGLEHSRCDRLEKVLTARCLQSAVYVVCQR